MLGQLLQLFTFVLSTSVVNENILLTKSNHFFITDTINQDTKEFFIARTQIVTDKQVYIYINSNGGSVIDGNDIIESIHFLINSGYEVNCIAQKAYSMAFHILQHCPNRLITETSSLMQHQIKLSIHDNYENIKSYLAMIEQINQYHIDYSAARLNLTSSEFKQKIDNDWWVYGSNIIKQNMADRIVSVGCEKELFDLIYRKQKRVQTIMDYLLPSTEQTEPIIELNGCPLLH